MAKSKTYKDLEGQEVSESDKFIYYKWSNTDSESRFDKETNKIICTCRNGSHAGINDKQVCLHKVRILVDLYKQGRLELK